MSWRVVSDTAGQVKEVVKPLIPLGGRILLDLTDVEQLDSSGLGTLVGLKASAVNAGYCRLELVNMITASGGPAAHYQADATVFVVAQTRVRRIVVRNFQGYQTMHMGVAIKLSRDCEVIEIPSGTRSILPAGSVVSIMQTLGGSYSVSGGQYGYMYRIDAQDADALGLPTPEATPLSEQKPFSEQLVWDELKTVFDPEIPVNIVDLGLVYGCNIAPAEQGGTQARHQDVDDGTGLRHGQCPEV